MIDLDSSDEEAAGAGDPEHGPGSGDLDAGCNMDIMAAAFQKAVGLGGPGASEQPRQPPADALKGPASASQAAEPPPAKRLRAEAGATQARAAAKPNHAPAARSPGLAAAAAAGRRAAGAQQLGISKPSVGRSAELEEPEVHRPRHASAAAGKQALPSRGGACVDLTVSDEEEEAGEQELDMLATQAGPAAASASTSSAAIQWACRTCTLHNDAQASHCVVCGEPRR